MKEDEECGAQRGRRRNGRMEMGGRRRERDGDGVVVRVRFLRRRVMPMRRGRAGWVVEGRSLVRGGNGSWDEGVRKCCVMEGYYFGGLVACI